MKHVLMLAVLAFVVLSLSGCGALRSEHGQIIGFEEKQTHRILMIVFKTIRPCLLTREHKFTISSKLCEKTCLNFADFWSK